MKSQVQEGKIINPQGIKILVVDDNPTNLRLIVDYLEAHGYTVLIAQAGDSGLRRAKDTQPDLILLDVMMPVMDGFDVCCHLKADSKTHEIPVIFLTALTSETDIVKGFEVGAVDYITKPIREQELLARVNTHLTLFLQRRQIEHQREQERIYFERLVMMKNEFVQSVSHDLKNPLNVITLSLHTLKAKGMTNYELATKHLTRMEKQTQRMKTLVVDLLDLAKLDTGYQLNLEMVSIFTFLEKIVERFVPLAQTKGITMELTPLASDIALFLDEEQMERVMDNLLSNAIKYTPAAGKIFLGATQEESELTLYVSDNGLGIPSGELPLIFNAFHRVRREDQLEAEGSGLGLSIVRSIVEQHNGHVWVDSTLGQGTTFYVSLPLSEPVPVV